MLLDGASRKSYHTIQEVEALFPRSKEEVATRTKDALKQGTQAIEAIISVPQDTMTFDSTFRAFDDMLEHFSITFGSISILIDISPDEAVRTAATEAVSELSAFQIDSIELHQELYNALLSYAQNNAEELSRCSEEARYFVEKTLKAFEKKGLKLPKAERERVRVINKEIADLSVEFQKNIAAATKTLAFTQSDLKGVDESFIKTLEKTDDGTYLVTTSYPHYNQVMKSEVAKTRERLYKAFYQRAYPENESILKKVIALRDELSKLLGYQSYAHYTLEDQMAESPERVIEFFDELTGRAYEKAKKDHELMMKYAPEDVEIIGGKFHPWDVGYVVDRYKKNHLEIDENRIAEYFPLKTTLPALLKIYEEFFDISFTKVEGSFWHEDVMAYQVYKDGIYRGTILLDIFPRPFKRTHPGCMPLVPGRKTQDGELLPSVSLVMANFQKDHEERPSLLPRNDMRSFFHEFGHALHALFGTTEFASLSGLSVAMDFVEMPSQMLEEWLWDPAILKRVSSHYKTGKPLEDKLIAKMIDLKQFGAADFIVSQSFIGWISLKYYLEGADKDVAAIMKELEDQYILSKHHVQENRFYAWFGHLMGYGPSYYGYLWSQVYAFDLFEVIKSHGLTDKHIGQRYIDTVLSKGASKKPEELVRAFLSREPSSNAFFKNYGI